MKGKPDRETWDLAMRVEELLEGTLSPEETVKLQDRIREDPRARLQAARLLRLHGEMKAAVLGRTKDLDRAFPIARMPPAAGRRAIFRIILAAGVIVLLGLNLAAWWIRDREPAAVLVQSRYCRWAESSLPTVEGSTIGAGHYRLVEGMAKFRFHSGAEVTLEAPSTLEILDGGKCRLREGSLIAVVPAASRVFSVDTPYVGISGTDTTYGVSAGDRGQYVVQMIRNSAEVTGKIHGERKRLTEGERFSDGDNPQILPRSASPESKNLTVTPAVTFDDGWHRITTAFGRGADTFIRSSPWEDPTSPNPDFGHGRHPTLMVKRADVTSQTNRQAYVRFDLGIADHPALEEASLILTIVPGSLGFGTLVPDAAFSVYGLTAENEDDWKETYPTWKHAPGHLADSPDPWTPDPARSTRLGGFSIPQGKNNGTVSLEGRQLVDFLKTDTNGLATLIICRDTGETSQGGLVHEFASKENGTAQPPTLRLKFKE